MQLPLVRASDGVLGDAVEAEDVVQEAVLRAYLGLAQLRDRARFGGWLAAIAINLARMRLRRPGSLPLADGDGAAAPSPVEAAEQVELVRSALDVLPDGQREAVRLHYLEGRSCEEIAALTGRSAGAVRVQLHRARAQLRRVLPSPRRYEREVVAMVEMTVQDVLVRVDAGEVAGEHRVILLREAGGDRVLPIWVGAPEGNALALHLGSELPLRPLTVDLVANLLETMGGAVERVVVSRLHEKTFYAAIRVAKNGDTAEVDARPSDALNLAVRVGAPIFADEDVLAAAAFGADELPARLDEVEDGYFGPVDRAGDWQSLSAELVKRLYAV